MSPKISLIAFGLLLAVACSEAQQYSQQLGGRRSSQDRPGLLRPFDDGSRASRNFDDLHGEQRFSQDVRRNQEQEQRQDRRNQEQEQHQDRRDRSDYDNEDYSYGYAVRDELSGDIKSQQEVRTGDRVRGQYRTVESDGTERIVDYTADDYRGFNAVVRHQPAVATRAQLVRTIQPAVLVRPAHVGQLVSNAGAGHRQPSATVILHQ